VSTTAAAEPRQVLPVDSPLRRRLPPLLRRAWYGLNQAFRRRIAHLGLTPDQFTVMRTLLEAEPRGLTQQELTERMTSDANTVASLVRRMEAAKLLFRRPHERDGRANLLTLRATGRRQLAEARLVATQLQTEVLRSVPEAERERSLELLSLIADACQQAAAASPTSTSRRRKKRTAESAVAES
jgi:DNA-binding MarR family transcriptional regulator